MSILSTERDRDIKIAINRCLELSRDSVCSLALSLESWANGRALPSASLASELGVPPEQLQRAFEVLPRAAAVSALELEQARSADCQVWVSGDPIYPPQLGDLSLPPPVIYCRGRMPARPAVAIVGSRRADAYGIKAAALFASRLAQAGLGIVSGLARGIDTAAHRSAISSSDGRTVAVLGCGIDVDYPRGSRKLREQIAEQGAILSELPLGAQPLPQNFPVRNRIIAALGVATIVVQAALRSGSLITARLALELGRDVWAVPGRIFDERSGGANALIWDGAYPALCPEHLLESLPQRVKDALRFVDEPKNKLDQLGERSARLLELMDPSDPIAADPLAQLAGVPVHEVLASLLELELDSRVRRHPGPRYTKIVTRI